jgi:hypothetical protein
MDANHLVIHLLRELQIQQQNQIIQNLRLIKSLTFWLKFNRVYHVKFSLPSIFT